MNNLNERALSALQMMLLIVVIFCGTFAGAAWMYAQVLLDCAEQVILEKSDE